MHMATTGASTHSTHLSFPTDASEDPATPNDLIRLPLAVSHADNHPFTSTEAAPSDSTPPGRQLCLTHLVRPCVLTRHRYIVEICL